MLKELVQILSLLANAYILDYWLHERMEEFSVVFTQTNFR